MTIKGYLRRTTMAAGALTAALAAVTVPAATGWAQAPNCGAAQLSPRIERPRVDDPQRPNQLVIVLANTSQQACTMQGFPGVDLSGPDDPAFGPTYSLPRQAGDPAAVTLSPGQAGAALLTYNPGAQNGWVPTTAIVTPPGDTTQLQIPWPAGLSVERQDAATHPGTYIGPVAPF